MHDRRRFLLQTCPLAAASGLGFGLSMSAVAAPSVRVAISVPGPGNLLYMPATLAGKIGADQAEGLEFELRHTGGGPQSYRDMLARNVDFAVAGLSALALQRMSGKPVVSVMAINQVPAYTLLVRQDLHARVRKVADLSGLVVGVKGHVAGGRSTTQLITEYVLAQAGLKADRVNYVSVGQSYASQHAALASGTVDAIMGDEPFATRLVGQKVAFVLADFHDPETTRATFGGLFLNAQLCTREDVIEKSPGIVEKVTRAMRSTLGWIGSHKPRDIVEALAPKEDDERRAWLRVFERHKRIYSTDGSFSDQQLATVERFLKATEKTEAAQTFRIDSMINSTWAGRKP